MLIVIISAHLIEDVSVSYQLPFTLLIIYNYFRKVSMFEMEYLMS